MQLLKEEFIKVQEQTKNIQQQSSSNLMAAMLQPRRATVMEKANGAGGLGLMSIIDRNGGTISEEGKLVKAIRGGAGKRGTIASPNPNVSASKTNEVSVLDLLRQETRVIDGVS